MRAVRLATALAMAVALTGALVPLTRMRVGVVVGPPLAVVMPASVVGVLSVVETVVVVERYLQRERESE